ncbi:hypothetical protein D9615_008639 [Tricholomella constricta]|uniref:Amino acid transporter n=1 Tax=Tricholomella constricta TaxID=117010 RepID=A0A8H5H443_9AGAR|nr:hypothetical protein D9615_008639 [Tricholomella constricta]
MLESVETKFKDAALEKDEAELARMGYKQELKRELGLMQNFGVSFSIISVITGLPSLFLYGLNTGGPAVMVWGWIVVSFFTILVGLAMAGKSLKVIVPNTVNSERVLGYQKFAVLIQRLEGLIFGQLCCQNPKTRRSLRGFPQGWFNLLGQVAVTTGISFACANFLSTACTLKTDFVPTPKTTIGIYAAVLFTQGLTNTFGVHLLHYMNNISVWWHAIGTSSLVVAILVKAPTHQSAKFVFQTFIDGTGPPGQGWSDRASSAYVVVIGMLMAQVRKKSFFKELSNHQNAAVHSHRAHMTEETHNAAMAGSIGIVMAVSVSAVLGWFLLLGLLFSIQDLDATLASETGQPVTQIFLDTVGENGAIVLMVIVIGAMYFCGTFSITSNSRMMYAFARDGGVPGHKFFNKVSATWKSPIRAVWLACTLSFILGLPSLGSSVAFAAATSIATIGLYISYGIPIALRVVYRDKFVRGPFHLGAFSFPVATAAVAWIAFISIAFILPQVNPVDSQTFNYSIVAVGIVIAYSVGFWLVSARKWFAGPVKQIAAEEMGIDVMQPGEMEKHDAAETSQSLG